MSPADTIALGIPAPFLTKKITLNTVATKESTAEKVPVYCKCKDEQTWCLTRHCAYVKAEVNCSIACHGGKNIHGGRTCPNISSAGTRGQRGLKVWNREKEVLKSQRGSKQQRKDTVGKLVKSRKWKSATVQWRVFKIFNIYVGDEKNFNSASETFHKISWLINQTLVAATRLWLLLLNNIFFIMTLAPYP